MLGNRGFEGLCVCQTLLQLFDSQLERRHVAVLAISIIVTCSGVIQEDTDLLSLPRAKLSLAAEHSFSRPAFSQAVQAGSLPSHYEEGTST